MRVYTIVEWGGYDARAWFEDGETQLEAIKDQNNRAVSAKDVPQDIYDRLMGEAYENYKSGDIWTMEGR